MYQNDPVTVSSASRKYVTDANNQPILLTEADQKNYEVHVQPNDKVLHVSG